MDALSGHWKHDTNTLLFRFGIIDIPALAAYGFLERLAQIVEGFQFVTERLAFHIAPIVTNDSKSRGIIY